MKKGFLNIIEMTLRLLNKIKLKKGNPKTYKAKRKSSFEIEQERGLIGSKVQARMRDTLDRSLSRTRI